VNTHDVFGYDDSTIKLNNIDVIIITRIIIIILLLS